MLRKLKISSFSALLLVLMAALLYADAGEELKKRVQMNLNKYYPHKTFTVKTTETGRVTIKGEVKSYWDKRNIHTIIARVTGVSEISNQLSIDTESLPNGVIKTNIERDLGLNAAILEPDNINISVNNGVVLLSGMVRFQREANIAENIASWQKGVKSINNELKVRPPSDPVSDDELMGFISKLMKRDFPLQKQVVVKVDDGIVFLTGTTKTLWTRNRIIRNVKRIHGVRSVENDLHVRKTTS
jgi:osmotically-inducible protein OsmY